VPSGKRKLTGAKLTAKTKTKARRGAARRAYHHGDLRRALVSAGLDLATEGRLEEFSLREVARRAGVSTAAPYWHFADRDALLAELAAECAARWLQAMRDAVRDIPAAETLRRLQTTGIAHVRFAVENPAHFRVMELPWIRDRMPDAVRDDIARFYDEEGARLVDAQRRGLLAPMPLELLKLATRSLVNGLAHLMISDDPQVKSLTPNQAVEVAQQVTRVFGLGLLPRPAPRRSGPK
jgi:AcrR family transcriptional regulator